MGDRLGTLGAVGITFLDTFCFEASSVQKQSQRAWQTLDCLGCNQGLVFDVKCLWIGAENVSFIG